jgi:hypothetical protein
LLESLRIEANHHLVTNNDSGSRAALVLLNHLSHRGKVIRNIANFEFDSSLREESLSYMAGRSTRLAVYDDLVFLHGYSIPKSVEGSLKRAYVTIIGCCPSGVRYE